MSSRSAAVLARAILFQLEALEPRRFLSGDAVEPVTIDPGGTQLSGSFAGGSIVRVAFQAEASAHYVFYKRSPNFIQMSILSEDGEESLAVAAFTELHQFLNRVDWTAPTTGTYLLELAKIADPYEGRLYLEYKLNVRVASDEVGDVVTQAVPIHDHEDVNGFIDSIDDSDWYSFNVEAGRLYRVARGYYEDDDWKGWVDFSLYNTDGVTEISSEEEYDFVFRATETGTYYLRAFTSARWSAADKYRLRVDSQVEPGYTPQTALDWDLANPIYGFHLKDNNYAHAFVRFEAQAGAMYVFNSASSKELDLRAADGQTVLAYGSYTSTGHRLIWQARDSSSYFLTVGYYTGNLVQDTGGPYVLSAQVIAPQDVPAAVSISPGETLNGELSHKGQIDLIKFEAKENAFYTFTMPYDHELYCCLQPDGPPIQFLLQVLGEPQRSANPADNVMYDVGGGHFLGEGAQWQAPSSGTHYLSVSSDDWAAAGAYQIAVTETLDDFGNNSEHAGSIAIDTPVQGRIDYKGDSDYFAFNAIAGHTYSVEAISDTPGDAERWGPGASVDALWPHSVDTVDQYAPGHSRVTFTANESLVYFVRVNGAVDQQYSVQVHETTLPVPPEDASALVPDQKRQLTVEPGQTVFLRLMPQAGSRYSLYVFNDTRDVPWYLADSSGAMIPDRYRVLDYSDENSSSLPTPLYVVIKGVEGLPAMQITAILETFRVHPPAPMPEPEPAPEPAPESVPRPATPPATSSESKNLVAWVKAGLGEGASDVFAFHALAGRAYRFRTVLGSLDDSVLGLFDPLTQKVIAVNDDTEDEALWDNEVQSPSSQVIWTADRTGDVYLIVYAYDPETSGAYRLETYSSDEPLKEETLALLAAAPARADEMVRAVDDALYADEDAWNDSQDGWDDSDWLDSDTWDDGEDW